MGMNKAYLGDSVYADFDGYSITLTTENGYGATNTIVLEPQVFASLIDYRDWLLSRANEAKAHEENEK